MDLGMSWCCNTGHKLCQPYFLLTGHSSLNCSKCRVMSSMGWAWRTNTSSFRCSMHMVSKPARILQVNHWFFFVIQVAAVLISSTTFTNEKGVFCSWVSCSPPIAHVVFEMISPSPHQPGQLQPGEPFALNEVLERCSHIMSWLKVSPCDALQCLKGLFFIVLCALDVSWYGYSYKIRFRLLAETLAERSRLGPPSSCELASALGPKIEKPASAIAIDDLWHVQFMFVHSFLSKFCCKNNAKKLSLHSKAPFCLSSEAPTDFVPDKKTSYTTLPAKARCGEAQVVTFKQVSVAATGPTNQPKSKIIIDNPSMLLQPFSNARCTSTSHPPQNTFRCFEISFNKLM